MDKRVWKHDKGGKKMSNNKGKAVVFLIIIIIISLGLGGGVYYVLQQEKAKSADLQQQLDDAKAQQQATRSELDEAKNKIGGLQSSLSDAQMKISDLNGNLEKERSAKTVSLKDVEKYKAELEKEKSLKAAIQKDLNDSVETLKVMESRLQELESKKKALEEKVKSLEEKVQSVELGKIVVSPDQAAAGEEQVVPTAGVKLEGKIAVVNKDYNFAVINLGNKDGVTVGNIFSVIHNNKNAGDLKVEKVHDNMAAAGFVTPDLKDKIAEGDKVELKK
jgi:predicted  nucleic acid-binding Zn-ribbon protein